MILDRSLVGDRISRLARLTLSAGATLLQLRDKLSPSSESIEVAKAIKRILSRYGVPFIINDRLDVALAVDADGLHIGQGDIDISLARKLLGRGKLIGVSVKTLKQAKRARRKGASYLGVGPIFKTPIKPKVRPKGFALLDGVRRLDIPFFAIGGIDCSNVHRLAKKGFKNIAVIRAICKAKDPYKAARSLKEAIE